MERARAAKLLRAGAVALVLAGVLLAAYSRLVEPRWLTVRHLSFAHGRSAFRLVHVSDIHYRGDEAWLDSIAERINALEPDFVCFTGDLADSADLFEEALGFFEHLQAPVIAVPGNHEHWSGASLELMRRRLQAQGGGLLVNQAQVLHVSAGSVRFVGLDDLTAGEPRTRDAFAPGPEPVARTVVLTHSPALFDRLEGISFDLGLAGHSHGGQVRLPLGGALILPPGAGRFQRGVYSAPGGTVYVSSGIGTYGLPVRLFCRPEVASIEF